jgi:hypothetical protein
MKAYRGSIDIVPPILKLSTRGRRVVNFMALLLSLVKERRYPLNRRLSGLQSWCGHFGEEKNLLPLPGYEPWTIQPVA